jgi:hypothetical protein
MSTPEPTLRALDRNLWAADAPLVVRGLELGTRTTLARLAEGGLLVHSPGPLAGGLRAEVEKLGPVRAIVAPNQLHHLFLADWAAAFPGARLFGAPGVAAKQPGLRFEAELGDVPPPLWAADLDQHLVRGAPSMNEVAFLHRATRTLLLADLAFNVRRSDSLFTRAFMRLNGAWGRFGPSRLMRHVVTRDRDALRASLERILAWDFDRVVVTHGDVLESGGREALRAGFAWLRLAA